MKENQYRLDIIDEYEAGTIPVITVEEIPDCNELHLIELPELTEDLSQGCGNVVVRFYYLIDTDTIYRVVSF